MLPDSLHRPTPWPRLLTPVDARVARCFASCCSRLPAGWRVLHLHVRHHSRHSLLLPGRCCRFRPLCRSSPPLGLSIRRSDLACSAIRSSSIRSCGVSLLARRRLLQPPCRPWSYGSCRRSAALSNWPLLFLPPMSLMRSSCSLSRRYWAGPAPSPSP
jgi:hypothetical protein